MREDVLAGIMEAPIAPRPWLPLFQALNTLVGDTRSMIKFTRADSPAHALIRTSADEDADGIAELYRQIYQFKDPIRYAGLHQCRLYSYEDLIERPALTSSDYYRELCEPLGMTHAFFAYLGRFDGVDTWFNGARSRAFSNADWQAIGAVLPFISRAAEYYCRIERYRTQSTLFAGALGQVGIGAVILDSEGRIVRMNREAERLMAREGLRSRAPDRLNLPARASHALAAMLTALRAGKEAAPAFLRLERADAQPLFMVLRQLRSSLSHSHAVMLYLRGANFGREDLLGAIMAFHDLTASEARLALLLAAGLPLDDAATELGLTISTARTYCKRILLKTGTKRQAELVALLANSLLLAELS